MTIACPNCATEIEVFTKVAPERPARKDVSPLTDKALADVFDFMRRLTDDGDPSRLTTARLFVLYKRDREGQGWVQLTKTAFARALSRNGAQRWRSADQRGFYIEPFKDGAKPARMSESVRTRRDGHEYRLTVEAHRGGTQPVASGPADYTPPFPPDHGFVDAHQAPAKDFSVMTLEQRLAELPLEIEAP